MQSHVNHEDAVTVLETEDLILLLLVGGQLELSFFVDQSS
jgi:hypothetical protein